MEVKRGRGRPPTGKIVVKVRLSPAQKDECLRHGETIQDGLLAIVNTAIMGTGGAAEVNDLAGCLGAGGHASANREPEQLPPAQPRWFCKSPKCYTHPANYGNFCSDCKSPRPI